MRNLRLISTTAAILLLGVGAVSAQIMKTDETLAPAPAAQQNAPAYSGLHQPATWLPAPPQTRSESW